jgi:hypothetical protein
LSHASSYRPAAERRTDSVNHQGLWIYTQLRSL